MTKGEIPILNHQPETAPELDNTEKIERAIIKGQKEEKSPKQILDKIKSTERAEMMRLIHLIQTKNDLSKKFTDPRPEAKSKKMDLMKESARLQKEFSTQYGFTFSEVNQVIKEQERLRQQKNEEARQVRVKREEERGKIVKIRDVIQTTEPRSEIGIIPPADTKLAALAARADATPKSTGLWGKFKSWLGTSRDERASAKFSQMQADSDKTPADFRAEAQGEAMMEKQDKKWFKGEMKKAQEEIEDERILAKEGPKWSAEAKRMMEEPAESPEMEAARIQSSAYNARKTAEENAQMEHDSVNIDAEITDPKVLEKIRQRTAKEKERANKLVAGYEGKFDKQTAKQQKSERELEDWAMDEDSSAQPGGEDKLMSVAIGGNFKRGVDGAFNSVADRLEERAGKKLVKKADKLDEFKVEMREAKQALKEQGALEKGQRMLDKAEGMIMSPKEFDNLMKAGKLRAKAEELEREVEDVVEPGLGEKAGVEFKNTVGEQLDKIEQEMTQLKPIIESTRLGGRLFGFKLKINKEGYVVNLPGHDEELAIQDLMKEKERLGKKGDTEGANKIVDQIEVLEKYQNLLVQRDKLLAGSGSTSGPRSMVVGGISPGGTPRTRH